MPFSPWHPWSTYLIVSYQYNNCRCACIDWWCIPPGRKWWRYTRLVSSHLIQNHGQWQIPKKYQGSLPTESRPFALERSSQMIYFYLFIYWGTWTMLILKYFSPPLCYHQYNEPSKENPSYSPNYLISTTATRILLMYQAPLLSFLSYWEQKLTH